MENLRGEKKRKRKRKKRKRKKKKKRRKEKRKDNRSAAVRAEATFGYLAGACGIVARFAEHLGQRGNRWAGPARGAVAKVRANGPYARRCVNQPKIIRNNKRRKKKKEEKKDS